MSKVVNADVIAQLGYQEDISNLVQMIEGWLASCRDDDMRKALQWQFQGDSKFFRPMTVFGCYRAVHGEQIPEHIMRSALVLEMFHNVSLVVDDIVDKSSHRRGKKTVHNEFGELSAFMASGYIVADAYEIISNDPYNTHLFSDLMRRLGVAEVYQWNNRKKPLPGEEEWRKIASEDTGSMFEVAACLGTRDDSLRKYGNLLGTLYHGCDDVGDVMGLEALGGGGEEDLRDGILTLPAALAIRDSKVRDVFCKRDRNNDDLELLRKAFLNALPEAEHCLDKIAEEARIEALHFSKDPAALNALVEHTRQLSAR